MIVNAMLQFAAEQTDPLKQRIKELESAVFHSERLRIEDAAEHQDDEIRLRQRIAELERELKYFGKG